MIPKYSTSFFLKLRLPKSYTFLNRYKNASALLLLLHFFQITLAQEIVFRTTVNKNNVLIGETFQVTFTLENIDGRKFMPPSFNDFYIVGGPNQSTNMQFINGNMTRSQSFSYYLQPKKEGSFTIQPAVIEANGKALKSNIVNITVSKTQNNNSNSNPGSPSNQNTSIEEQIRENVFVKMHVDKTNVFQGEQITVSYKFYKRLPITAISIEKSPTFNGFWNYSLEDIQQLSYQKEIINGVQFEVANLKRVALFPQKTGDLEIDEMALNITVRIEAQRRSRSIWDDFFGTYQDIPLVIQSNTSKIKVKPLPNINKPTNFNGVVGKFNMDVKLDKTEAQVDEPLTLSIKISGTGNIKMIERLNVELPKDFDLFDPKVNEVIKKGNTASGSKTFDYLIVPRRPGEFKIPPFKFSYFDIEKGDYVTHTSQESIIKITGEANASPLSQSISGIKKEEVELLGKDIRYIKTSSIFQEKNKRFFATPLFFVAYTAPILLLIGLFLYRKNEQQLNKNTTLLRKRKAGKLATQRLALAKKWMEQNDKSKFCNETAKSLWGFLSDKLNIPTSELSKANATDLLNQKNLNQPLLDNLFQTIETCEMALFSGAIENIDLQKIYQNAENIIIELEAKLK